MPKKILIVDDNPDFLFILNGFLKQAGYSVVSAASGNDCLAKAKSEKPDMIILDILMPDMDGWEVCEILRATLPAIPISMCSVLNKQHHIDKSFRVGANEHITKPLRRQSVLSTIENLFEPSA